MAMTIAQSKVFSRARLITVPVMLMLAAGIIHFVVVPHHYEHAPAHGIALGVIGGLEVIWAAAYWLRPSRRLAQAGVLLAVSMIVLWGITRVAPAPFTNAPEEVDLAGVASKLLEGISAAVLLGGLVRAGDKEEARPAVRSTIAGFLLASVMLGAVVYTAARVSQPLFPGLVSPAGHVDDHEH